MTIKKPMKIARPGATVTAAPASGSEPAAAAPASAAPAAGAAPAGAAIADRFKLDAPAAKPKSSGGGVSALIAGIAALVALGVAGMLTFIMYGHWEFLKGA